MKNKIKLIVPFYNPGDFLRKCIASIKTQDYDNFETIFVDDCSTDGAWDLLPHDDEKSICKRNEVRKTALENIHDAIMDNCDKDDIVVLLDGDDWLQRKNSLSYINDFFNEHDCWIMYGQASWTNGQKGIARPYENESEFNNMRNKPFYVSHIRCFRAGLYHKIQEQDENFSCMKDSNGEFYKMTYDVAIMYPIMEMAGYERTKYNDKALYVYNKHNPISDDKVNHALQYSIHQEINRKPSFSKIENY
jgi:glycosyltransferase involved in cell wall biosynthesis